MKQICCSMHLPVAIVIIFTWVKAPPYINYLYMCLATQKFTLIWGQYPKYWIFAMSCEIIFIYYPFFLISG